MQETFEPPHDKTNKMACAPSKDSDQPGHPPSLIRVFAVRMKKALVLSYPKSAQRRLWSDWADAQADLSLRCDQTGQMPRLIWIFAGRTLILLILSRGGSYYLCMSTPFTGMYGKQQNKLSRLMTKPTKWVCAQQRLRSAWASAQSDQSLRCVLNG